jgi:hypothetical protein
MCMLCHSKPSPFRKAEFLVLTDSFASLNFLELKIFFFVKKICRFFWYEPFVVVGDFNRAPFSSPW